jgi:hypothetical protein
MIINMGGKYTLRRARLVAMILAQRVSQGSQLVNSMRDLSGPIADMLYPRVRNQFCDALYHHIVLSVAPY